MANHIYCSLSSGLFDLTFSRHKPNKELDGQEGRVLESATGNCNMLCIILIV